MGSCPAGHPTGVEEAWHPCCPPPTGLVEPVRRGAEDSGGPTPGILRGPAWLQVGRGWHVPAGTPRTPEQRAYEVGVRLRPDGLVTGWAALRLAGARYFEDSRRIGARLSRCRCCCATRRGFAALRSWSNGPGGRCRRQ